MDIIQSYCTLPNKNNGTGLMITDAALSSFCFYNANVRQNLPDEEFKVPQSFLETVT